MACSCRAVRPEPREEVQRRRGGKAERRKNQEEEADWGEGRWQCWEGATRGAQTGRTSCLVEERWGRVLRGAWGHVLRPLWPQLAVRLSKMPCSLGLAFSICQTGRGSSDWAGGSQPFHPQRTPLLLLVDCRLGSLGQAGL